MKTMFEQIVLNSGLYMLYIAQFIYQYIQL